MGKIDTKAVMITNRGPNFTTQNTSHKAMGGTKGIYPQIMSKYCDKWMCIMPRSALAGNPLSEYGEQLDILGVNDEEYNKYYYSYVSETLYPYLLGYKSLMIEHPQGYLDTVVDMIAEKIKNSYMDKPIILCDYHLYKLPAKLPRATKKIFYWFIPILTIDHYDERMADILDNLDMADEIILFDDVWVNNYINAFHHFFPTRTMHARVYSIMMGPDEYYEQPDPRVRMDYISFIEDKFGASPTGKQIISVCRMDFVKRVPLLIEGYEKYRRKNPNSSAELYIVAPYHRHDSLVYRNENDLIITLTKKSDFSKNIHITHNNLSSAELRLLFKYADVFVCPSTYDAMPLTPLEYILANDGNGAVILSDTIGSYRLLSTLAVGFRAEDSQSLAFSIDQALRASDNNMHTMKEVVSKCTIQKAIA
jgi:trehalose-6-phosphate synthase